MFKFVNFVSKAWEEGEMDYWFSSYKIKEMCKDKSFDSFIHVSVHCSGLFDETMLNDYGVIKTAEEVRLKLWYFPSQDNWIKNDIQRATIPYS